MASITRESNGRKTIQFVGSDGKRRSIRLGKMPMRQAEAVRVKVEDLASASITAHAPSDETVRWLAGLDHALYAKLSAVRLVLRRDTTRLGAFLDDYVSSRIDVKPSTLLVLGHTKRNLIEHFGMDKPLRDITPGDADGWRLYLVGLNLAENTVRRRCGIAKQYFRAAVRKGLIATNPFSDLTGAVQANTSRFYFVTREESQAVLEACPDAQWRLLFALSRYGGLRSPSETLALRWDDVDWEHNRITVRSPKTEHHPGGESRQIPLFPELRPYLLEVFEQADPGTEHVITRYRKANTNLGTQLKRIIGRAGLMPWPKLFQNLRSTRETELAERFPMHVVCAWIGNSQPVAAKHYLQITEDHFDQASQPGTQAVQNPVQQPAEMTRNPRKPEDSDRGKSPLFQGFTSDCKSLQTNQMGDTGLEPVTSSL